MSLTPAPTLTLANGIEMPQVGLGTWPLNDQQAAEAVTTALELGYRMIDTAENYNNEVGVGQGIRNASVPRDQVFVTTKFNRQWHGFEGAQTACEASLQRLGLDYIDLLLIHWPNPDQDRFVEAYLGLLNLQDKGLVRAIGTSNFKPAHLQRLLALGLTPQVNQIQLDPYHRRDDLISLHQSKGIVTESWRPLGCGNAMLADPVVTGIAAAHQCTPAQIVLRWAVQQGFATAPKSANPARMAENLSLFDFALSDSEMAALDQLGRDDPEMLDADSFGH
ncbi:aldo/keto reductase [Marinobacterium sediminicola]|uniref:2,5-diketo-D-gluconate reductase A n=1 Tax=Marinobacterium sediminicola TaxID=518898 RepID=A0ABY1S1T0_9GAMM|nr:aldo/keto reductase [Marinobacterium sediminicola]ULG69484.1 aldo/keto reductase [Marinobacterium sediminicola]SMR75634.1 2,5-diketo-D-gluconate reductase A [Marinobacterium sediminicola]